MVKERDLFKQTKQMTIVSFVFLFSALALVLSAFLFLIFEIYAVVVGSVMGAPFVRSAKNKIDVMMELAEIKSGEAVMDLGSGDGSLLIEAAKRGCRAAIGVEINPFLVWHSRRRIKKLGLEKIASVIRGDFRNFNLAGADAVFLYLMPEAMDGVCGKIRRELKPGGRAVSNGFSFKGIAAARRKDGVYLYKF